MHRPQECGVRQGSAHLLMWDGTSINGVAFKPVSREEAPVTVRLTHYSPKATETKAAETKAEGSATASPAGLETKQKDQWATLEVGCLLLEFVLTSLACINIGLPLQDELNAETHVKKEEHVLNAQANTTLRQLSELIAAKTGLEPAQQLIFKVGTKELRVLAVDEKSAQTTITAAGLVNGGAITVEHNGRTAAGTGATVTVSQSLSHRLYTAAKSKITIEAVDTFHNQPAPPVKLTLHSGLPLSALKAKVRLRSSALPLRGGLFSALALLHVTVCCIVLCRSWSRSRFRPLPSAACEGAVCPLPFGVWAEWC